MASTRVNKAAMRRAREQLVVERTAPRPPLPDDFLAWLDTVYEPRGEKAPEWGRLKPFVVDALERSTVRGRASIKQHVTHLACFGYWLIKQGLPLGHTSITRANVDEYARMEMADITAGSRVDRRSRLRSLADQIHPGQAPVRPQLSHRDALKPPYTPEEMRTIVWAAKTQPTARLVRQMCLCVGLGAGAGIDSAELKILTGDRVADHGTGGIEVRIPGKRERTVWVLREREGLVRRGMDGVKPTQPLLGVKLSRSNVANYLYGRAHLHGDVPKPEQSRLRTTWIATLMARPIPMAVICRAAGLQSTRTLFDLLPFIQTPDDAGMLRDGGRP